ncbi:hypothetical protein AB0C81_24070 [Streptomyces roseoverticillatus]|uniref:hypothetical protein n=1 Tax=Streptomyces roseoverticillatus TaxID=66429 RepID=UPI0033CF1329
MNELIFRGKDRYRPSWSHVAILAVLLAVEGAAAAVQLGPTGFYWLLGGTAVLVGLALLITLRSWTAVGAAGISICWGIGRARTHPWQEIRWIDVRETRGEYGTTRMARITLANGRRRSLPGLQHSDTYPGPDFDVDFQRVVNWWELTTDQALRFRPPRRLRDRLSPTALGVVLGILLSVVIVAVVAVRS